MEEVEEEEAKERRRREGPSSSGSRGRKSEVANVSDQSPTDPGFHTQSNSVLFLEPGSRLSIQIHRSVANYPTLVGSKDKTLRWPSELWCGRREGERERE